VDQVLENRIQNTEYRIQETEERRFKKLSLEREIKIIQRPPKICLDTNHLINITKVRNGETLSHGQSANDYLRLNEYLKSYCGIIFNPVATMNWVSGGATEESASEIAAVMDSAKLKYMMPEEDYGVYTYEIIDQCRKQIPNIRLPNLPPIPQNISDKSTYILQLNILLNQVPNYLEDLPGKRPNNLTENWPVFTVQEWVQEIFKKRQNNPEKFQNRTDGFNAQLSEDINRRDEYFSDPKHYQKEWIKRYPKIDKILKAFNPQIDVDSILDMIDPTKCPAVNLYWKVREKRMKSGNRPHKDDVNDYTYLAVVPYADIVLIEKQLRGFILQADRNLGSKVLKNVADALVALDR
jgi:hypothetical protein